MVYPEIDPIIFSIGPVSVRWYGMMYVLGFLAAWALAWYRSERKDAPVDRSQVDDLIFWAMVGVIVGGRVGSVLFYNWEQFASDPLYLVRIWQGGMSFHGGLIGVMVAMWLYGRKLGKTIWHVTDFVAPLVPIGLGLGRIGNFINAELWGKPTDVAWGFVYEGVKRHPSQLYEAALEGLVLFIILWTYSAKPRPYMAVSGMFLLWYGAFRFFIEFYRLPDADIGYLAFGWLTMGQVLSTPMIVAGAVMLVFAYRSHNRGEAPA